jgi:branched-chain amino acid transport system substrate-binding protein
MQRRGLSIVAAFAGLTLVVAACGAPAPGGGTTAEKGEIIIVSEFPTSGASGASGLPAQNGVAFALSDVKNIKGFKITHRANDHSVSGTHDPQKATQNIQQAISDSKVLAVVGPFNSNIATAIGPVANRASLALISPANTNECLTQDLPYCTTPSQRSMRPLGLDKINYFRIAAPDTVQGPAMADFAYDTLKFTKIAVWSDNEVFGKGVADNFSKRFTSKGGTIVVRQDFDTKTTNDWRPFLQRAKEGGAQAVYAGAVDGTKGCVPRAQMKGILDTAPYLGPDGIFSSECPKQAGDMAKDIYVTNAAADATQDPEQKAIVDKFKATFTKAEDLGSYTFPAYDCAKIVLDAISRAIDTAGGNMPTRQQVIDAIAKTSNLKLTTGTYSFDKNGDPTRATMAIHQYKGTDFVFIRQFPVGQ